jgi:succinylglutamate desuccinylase
VAELLTLDAPPEGLFDTPAKGLAKLLGGPALVKLQGDIDPPLFLSVLLHGNETSGWDALCEVMKEQSGEAEPDTPTRSIVLFIGNVEAAAQGLRSLPGQMDFNRIWAGEHEHSVMVEEVLAYLRAHTLFAALDLHNNTGRNPHYSVLTEITPQTCGLAYLFSDKAVLVEEPDSVLTRAVAPLCPATTVEVGPVNDPQSAARTAVLLRRYLRLDEVPTEPVSSLTLHRAVARVHVVDGASFDFADEADANHLSEDDLVLTAGMEAVNFHPLMPGTEFGFTRKPLHQTLVVLDPQHRDVTAQFFEETHGDISLRRPVIPAMYTTDHKVIRQDCLCYFMEEI